MKKPKTKKVKDKRCEIKKGDQVMSYPDYCIAGKILRYKVLSVHKNGIADVERISSGKSSGKKESVWVWNLRQDTKEEINKINNFIDNLIKK